MVNPPPQAIEFALSPGQATNGVYDFTTTEHAKIYKAATAALQVVHDGTSKTLRPMLEELKLRAEEFNWDETILKIKDSTNAERSLIDQSRLLKVEEIKAAANVYINKPTRAAQDNSMAYRCVMASLSTEGHDHLIRSRHVYKIEGTISVTLLIKALIQMCEIETYFTSFMVRNEMSKLTTKLSELKYDINAFNEHVTTLEQQLLRNNETSDDLFIHVLNAYSSCEDQKFQSEVDARRRLYEGGDLPLELNGLLIFGKTQFDRLKQLDTYLKPSKEQEQIIALTAKLDQAHAAMKSKSTSRSSSTTSNRRHTVRPAWMTQAPAADEPQVKKVDGKTYYYCQEHQCWGFHKESDCRKRKKRLESSGTTAATASVSETPVTEQANSSLHASIAAVLQQANE